MTLDLSDEETVALLRELDRIIDSDRERSLPDYRRWICNFQDVG